MPRARTVAALLAAIAVPMWLWQRTAPQPDPQTSKDAAKPGAASTAAADEGRPPTPGSGGSTAGPTFAAPGTANPEKTRDTADSRHSAPGVPVRLDVHAPPSARVGDRITIRIDAEAFGGIEDLSFVVSYDDRTLAFVSASPGSFVQQASAPATLSAEDPSTSGVVVRMRIKNGGVVAGGGTVVVLDFDALQPGTSPITLREVAFVEHGRASTGAIAAVGSASVTIEQR